MAFMTRLDVYCRNLGSADSGLSYYNLFSGDIAVVVAGQYIYTRCQTLRIISDISARKIVYIDAAVCFFSRHCHSDSPQRRKRKPCRVSYLAVHGVGAVEIRYKGHYLHILGLAAFRIFKLACIGVGCAIPFGRHAPMWRYKRVPDGCDRIYVRPSLSGPDRLWMQGHCLRQDRLLFSGHRI